MSYEDRVNAHLRAIRVPEREQPGYLLRQEIKRERAKMMPVKHEESRKVTTYEPFPEGPPENWPTEYVSLADYEALQATNENVIGDLQETETESRRLAGMVMSLDLLVMSANEIICNSPGNIQPWLDACAVLGRNLTPSG